MRRKDREVTDRQKISEIMSQCFCCRLGFNDEGEIYIIPLNFGFREKEGQYTLYFHGAMEGRKIELIRKTGVAGFEMDTNHQLIVGDKACDFSSVFQSVIGTGEVSLVKNTEQKKEALQFIMKHYSDQADWEFNEKMVQAVCVFKMEVREISCKEHIGRVGIGI